MKKPSSNLGLTLSGLYLIFVIYTVIDWLTCGAWLCGLIIIFPSFPWFYLWAPLVEGSGQFKEFLGYSFLIASVCLNVWLFYQIGKLIGRLVAPRTFR